MQPVRRLCETFKPDNYTLALDLTHTDERRFSGSLEINGISEIAGELSLHAKDLSITNAWIDTTKADVQYGENDEITLRSPVIKAGNTRVTIDFTGTINDAMHGLYPCYYELEGTKKELFATQFESHHAREVFPCVDEPEAKSTFDLQLITKPGLTALANTKKDVGHENQDGMIEHVFQTSPRMSTYLLAFVVGDLQKASATSANGTEINVWSTPAQPLKSLDWGLEVAVKTIDFYEEFYGVPFPLQKCDHVALPDFSAGAMENWGLITYREVCLLSSDDSPITHKRYVATVIAHELAHQWFGNLVTMKWWDDLWLNESFANVMEYIALDHLYPEWEIWDDFATDEIPLALERDRFKDIQPVSYQINHPDEIGAAFDKAIVYAKGSRLIRMAMVFAGEDAFRRGLQTYFRTFKYANATGSDLWKIIGDECGKDVDAFMSGWLSQPGYPVVTVHTSDDVTRLTQRRFGTDTESMSLWTIPIGDNSFATQSSSSAPLLPLNGDAISHVLTSYDDQSYKTVLSTSLTIPEKLDLLYASTLLAESGDQPVSRAFELMELFRTSDSDALWSGILHTLAKLAPFHETTEQPYEAYAAWLITPAVLAVGLTPSQSEAASVTKLRSTILGLLAGTNDRRLLDMAHGFITDSDSLRNLHGDMRFALMKAYVRRGPNESVALLLGAHDSTHDAALRDDILRAVCYTDDPLFLTQLVDRLGNSKLTKPQDLPKWFAALMRNPRSRQMSWSWLESSWPYVMKHFAGDMSLDKFPQYAAQFMHGDDQLSAYKRFFLPLLSAGTERSIRIGIDMIENRTAWVERDMDTVGKLLAMHATMDSNDS